MGERETRTCISQGTLSAAAFAAAAIGDFWPFCRHLRTNFPSHHSLCFRVEPIPGVEVAGVDYFASLQESCGSQSKFFLELAHLNILDLEETPGERFNNTQMRFTRVDSARL